MLWGEKRDRLAGTSKIEGGSAHQLLQLPRGFCEQFQLHDTLAYCVHHRVLGRVWLLGAVACGCYRHRRTHLSNYAGECMGFFLLNKHFASKCSGKGSMQRFTDI